MPRPIIALSDPTIVALGLFVFVAAIIVVAIYRYNANDFMKFWAATGTVIGVALGSVGTFFFTKSEIERTELRLRATQFALETGELRRSEAAKRVTQLSKVCLDRPEAVEKVDEIRVLLRTESPSPFNEKLFSRKASPDVQELLRLYMELMSEQWRAHNSSSPTPTPSGSASPFSSTGPIEPEKIVSPTPSKPSPPKP
jgi:hypothetical protein